MIWFRGTDTLRDWKHNIRSRLTRFHVDVHPSRRVHRGFLKQWRALRPHVIAWLQYHTSITRLYIAGHSLGGALSILCGTALLQDFPVRLHACHVMAVGCPRVGNANFARHVQSMASKLHIVRVCDRRDVVPTLPFWRYRHVGIPVYLATTFACVHGPSHETGMCRGATQVYTDQCLSLFLIVISTKKFTIPSFSHKLANCVVETVWSKRGGRNGVVETGWSKRGGRNGVVETGWSKNTHCVRRGIYPNQTT